MDYLSTGSSLEKLGQTLFVLWGFPEVSQTFIQREMTCMKRLGGEVNVLAAYRVKRRDLDPDLARIADKAIYLGSPLKWTLKGIAYAALRPARFLSVALWMLALPHRTLFHRLRAQVMLLAAASVASKIQSAKVHHIQAHFTSYPTEFAMCLSRLTSIPYGITGHATGIWKDRNILAEKIAGATTVLTCTNFNAKHLRNLAGDHMGKVFLCHHGLDLTSLPLPSEMPQGPVTQWVAVGRLVPKKGFTYLIQAVAMLRDLDEPFSLTIMGEGPERKTLEKQIERLSLRSKVTLTGAVTNQQVFDRLNNTHALVAPSIKDGNGDIDGIPNVVLEAMAMGRPVLGSSLSGIPEVVLHGETGYLVRPRDINGLAQTMLTMGRHHSSLALMGSKARRLIEKHFDVQKNVRQQLDVLNSAIEK